MSERREQRREESREEIKGEQRIHEIGLKRDFYLENNIIKMRMNEDEERRVRRGGVFCLQLLSYLLAPLIHKRANEN
jgi:hypothetical protein